MVELLYFLLHSRHSCDLILRSLILKNRKLQSLDLVKYCLYPLFLFFIVIISKITHQFLVKVSKQKTNIDSTSKSLFVLNIAVSRVMLEKDVPREIVESDYKKYIPKECIKRHSFFIKKPIHNALARISGHDASYVKEQYLNQFESMAPNYPCEEHKALMDKGIPNPASRVLLRVNMNDVKYCESENSEWHSLCAIEDLCFVSIRQDSTVEVSRKNGIPSYLKFGTNALLMSFVSSLDGYYRLAVKWTFNLCRDVITPSLQILHKHKCHGPVGYDSFFSDFHLENS